MHAATGTASVCVIALLAVPVAVCTRGLSEASSGWASICSGKDIPTLESGLSHGHPEHGST